MADGYLIPRNQAVMLRARLRSGGREAIYDTTGSIAE